MSIRNFKFSAPGKIILFGEHAVVYGYTAISTAISKRMYAKCEYFPTLQSEVNIKFQDKIVNFNPNKSLPNNSKLVHQMIYSSLKNCFNNKHHTLNVEIIEEFPSGNGLGSSASLCSIISAISDKIKGKEFNKDSIFNQSKELEKFFHGNSSGIDPATVVYGKGIKMNQKNISLINFPSIPLLIVDTGKIHETSKAVNHVKNLINKFPTIYKPIISTLGNISDIFLNLNLNDQINSLKYLFPTSNYLLNSLGLNCFESDLITQICLKNNLFTKISGAGMGGIMLITGNNLNEKKNLFKKFNVLKIDIGSEGIKEEI